MRAEEMMNEFDVQQEVDRLLLTSYAPASVVIDDDLLILYIRGRTSPYLEPTPGKADGNLLKWVCDGLKQGVRTAIQSAQKENHPVSREGLQVSGTTRMVRVTVEPLQGPSTTRCFLVLFEESPSQAPLATESGVTGAFFGRRGQRSGDGIGSLHCRTDYLSAEGTNLGGKSPWQGSNLFLHHSARRTPGPIRWSRVFLLCARPE
jgi:hypothetical protein